MLSQVVEKTFPGTRRRSGVMKHVKPKFCTTCPKNLDKLSQIEITSKKTDISVTLQNF